MSTDSLPRCIIDRQVLSLCVVAWTLGLRHALDMDHIVAIDNVTRSLVAQSPGAKPILVGLFFALGHSTVVIAATIMYVGARASARGCDC